MGGDGGAVAAAYDRVAAEYAAFVRDALERSALDRAVLGAFAAQVSGVVADLGCGPGYLTAHLRGLGVDAYGVDLSAELIGTARRTYPEIRFERGPIQALDLADGVLGGAMSWYSVIHAAPGVIPAYLAEFRRVLAPGGHLLLGFFEADGGPLAAFDHKVVEAYVWPVDEMAALTRAAGFTETGRVLRAPLDGERFRHGRLLLRAT